MKHIPNLILIFLLAINTTACRVKKKVVDRQSQTTELNTKTTAEDLHTADVATETAVASKTTFLKVDSHSSINLTQADPGKQIVIEDASGAVMKITGANAIISKGSTKEQKTDTMATTTKTEDKSVTQKKTAEETTFKNDLDTRKTSSKVFGVSTWVYIIIIVIMILLLIVFRKKVYELYKKILPGI